MGARKRLVAEARKEAKKGQFFAQLNNCPTSPRKMRMVADLIRGKKVNEALDILRFNSREAAGRLEKLVSSAIFNYEAKSGLKSEAGDLFIKTVGALIKYSVYAIGKHGS